MFIKIKKLIWLTLLAFSTVLDQASPLSKRDTCTPPSAEDRSIDDEPAISKALSTCGDGGTIVIPAGKTFMIRSPLDFSNCSACDFQIEGTLKASDDLAYWEGKATMFTVPNVAGATIRSLTGLEIIDGSGQAFWDYFAINNTYERPSLVHLTNVSNVTFTNIRVNDAPKAFIYVKENSVNIKFSELVVSAVSTSANKPSNTDGFDTADCSYITFNNIQVTNGDDCIAFKGGSNYISIKNITCVVSHGLSLGSLGLSPGRIDKVQNVYVSDAIMINSTKAVGIKLYPGGSSHGTVFVSNITFESDSEQL
jgi:galacturan 1,4-alpha-galacturonidase